MIKKMCVLCRLDADYAGIARRLDSFYFLGTPHWSSNLASTLSNIIRLSGLGRRAVVSGSQTKNGDIVFLQDNRIVVVKNGLENGYQISLAEI